MVHGSTVAADRGTVRCLLLSPTLSAFVLMSVEEEVRWGHEAQAAMRKQAPLVSDPAIGGT